MNPDGFATREISIRGTTYSFRELSVEENDECNDAGIGPDGKWLGRAALRLMITKSAVTPRITLADLAKMPLSVYTKVAEAVNEVNSREIVEDTADPKRIPDDDFVRFEVARLFGVLPWELKRVPIREYRKMKRYASKVREARESSPGDDET